MANKLLLNSGLIASMLVSFGIGFYANYTPKDKVCKEPPITTTMPIEPPLPPPPPPPTLPVAVKCPVCDKSPHIKYIVVKDTAKQLKPQKAQHKSETIVQTNCTPKIEYKVVYKETKSTQSPIKETCQNISGEYGLQLLKKVK